MNTELVIASNNSGKIAELRAILPDVLLLSLDEIGFKEEIPEPFHTFQENALTKAQTVFNFCGKNVFADDSGICVSALNNEPGVHSAYFGGLPRSDEKNNDRLLAELKNKTDRSAFYKTVICLIWKEQPYFFEGICKGNILHEPRGSKGFGYDPLFVPEGYDQSFGELPAEIKNKISHRARATEKMIAFLQEHIIP